MKKSFWNKTQNEMTFGDSVKGMVVVYVLIITFAATFCAVMFKLEEILDWMSETKRRIQIKFSHKKWVQTEKEESEEDWEYPCEEDLCEEPY